MKKSRVSCCSDASTTRPTSPNKTPTEVRKSAPLRTSRHHPHHPWAAGSLPERGSAYSLASLGSSASSLHTPHPHDQTDEAGIPDTDSVVSSSRGSASKSMLYEDEEEGHTIGSQSSAPHSHNSSPQTRRISLPWSHAPIIPPPGDHQAPQTTDHHRHRHQEKQQQQGSDSVLWFRIQSYAYKFLVYAHQFISWLIFIIQKGIAPTSKPNVLVLMRTEGRRSPLADALFSLGSEASARHCPRLWACARDTQLALLVLAGGGMERYLWRELRLLVCDEVNWTRALYSLRHTLWPGGKFLKGHRSKPSEVELEQLKRKAADAFKKFLPSEFAE